MEHEMTKAYLPEEEETNGVFQQCQSPKIGLWVGYPTPLHVKACLCFRAGTSTSIYWIGYGPL
ncbi:hypothetical protein Tco_0482832, partial [Tanacetum coccineum]